MTNGILPLSRINNWELLIYNQNNANPVNLASYCELIEIQIDPADDTGLYRQFVDIELKQPVILNGQTLIVLERNAGNLKPGNRLSIRYRKTNNDLVTVFEGRIFRFIEQSFRKIKFRAACLLSTLDTPRPAGNFANYDDPYGATVNAQTCLNRIFTATGYGNIDFSNTTTVVGNPKFPLNKPENEGLVTQAGKFISQFCRNFLWHNPRTNKIEAWPMNLSAAPSREFSDKPNAPTIPAAILEYDTDLDYATTKTAVTSTVPVLVAKGPAGHPPLAITFDGITITKQLTWNGNEKIYTVITSTPIQQLQSQETLARWGNVSGNALKSVNTRTIYEEGWLKTEVTTEIADLFYTNADWIKDCDELYNRSTAPFSSTIVKRTTKTYSYEMDNNQKPNGNLLRIKILEELHDWVRAPELPESNTPILFPSLREEQQTEQNIEPVAGGYKIETIVKKWEYEKLGSFRIVGKPEEPQFSQDRPQGEPKPMIIDGQYYSVETQPFRAIYTGSNLDINPYRDEIKEINAEYCDSEEKCLAFAELQHKLALGRELALRFEVDATDTMLDTWRPWEVWKLTKFGNTANYVITEIAFYLDKNTASFKGRALRVYDSN